MTKDRFNQIIEELDSLYESAKDEAKAANDLVNVLDRIKNTLNICAANAQEAHKLHNDLDDDLVSFGKYLLSEERREKIRQNPSFHNEYNLQERLAAVHDSDISNWRIKEKAK